MPTKRWQRRRATTFSAAIVIVQRLTAHSPLPAAGRVVSAGEAFRFDYFEAGALP